MKHAADAGFALVDALVGSALAVLLLLGALGACRTVATAAAHAADPSADGGTLDAAAAALRTDAAGALAIALPAADAQGAPNDPAAAHELDLWANDARGAWHARRYRYDAARHELQVSDVDANGAAGVREPATGVIEPAATYPPIRGVTTFDAHAVAADALGSAANDDAGIGALLTTPGAAYRIPFGLPDAAGGNTVTVVTLGNGAGIRTVHLLPGTVGGGFTVTGKLTWHAVVYRVDHTRRFLFGLGQKSDTDIRAQVDVRYAPGGTGVAPPPVAWCTGLLIYTRLDGNDPRANYDPHDPAESPAAILRRCRTVHPTPPPPGAPGAAPDPDVVAQPAPAPADSAAP